MKIGLKIWLSILLVCPLLMASSGADALIKFDAKPSIRIDLEKLEVGRQQFLAYITDTVHQNPFGLQAYGQVPFSICDMKLKGRRLIDYQTPKGRKIRFISNPSCGQIVLQRLLELNYDYDHAALGYYDNRKCIRAVEGIFSPLLEYYTIHYEEKSKPECDRCDAKERDRLDKISRIQDKIVESCGPEKEKVVNFLNDLDPTIEKAFQTKKTPSR